MTANRFRYNTATTLDGYLADVHNSLDWLFVQTFDESGPMSMDEFMADIGAIVMGSTTYRWLLEHEISADSPWPYSQPCFVFSHRDLEAVADTVHIVAGTPGDLRERIVAAAGDRDVWVVGGGDLAAQFAGADMLDEITVSIAPVTLGAGAPLFPRPFDLELTEIVRNGDFACLRYRVVGPRKAADRAGDAV